MNILEEIVRGIKTKKAKAKRIAGYLVRSALVAGLYVSCGGDEREPCGENGSCSPGYMCVEDCTGPCGEPVSCEYVCEPEPCQDCYRVEDTFEAYEVGVCLQK